MTVPTHRTRSRSRLIFLALCFLLLSSLKTSPPVQAAGCISLDTLGMTSTESFDTLASTGKSSSLPSGWYFSESGTNADNTYTAGTGSSNGGDTYSFGPTGSTERALGSLQSTNLIPTLGACVNNNTGSTITSLALGYTGEEWRLGTASRTDQLTFGYSTDATSLTTGTWTTVSALNFVTPDTATTGAKNGNAAGDRTVISSTISSLSIANGVTFWIRWIDVNASNADDGLAVDDFSITASASAPLPNLTVNDVSLNEGSSGTTTFTFTASLSAPAGAGGVTFDIATADGTATASSDYATRSLTGQTIPAGSSIYTFDVLVNGDTIGEADETFFVNVINVTGANVTDGQGLGTIVNDDAVITSIHDIQGTGATSSMVGQTVTLQGIVVGDYQGAFPQLGGFFVQEEDIDADANSATSEGIFVLSNTPVSRGDLVEVDGMVTEYSMTSGGVTSHLTELANVTRVQVLSTANTLPTATRITLPYTNLSELECYEGMLVTFPQELTVTDVYALGRYGQVDLSVNGRLSVPTNVVDPGTPAIDLENLNARRRILLDDTLTDQYPDPEIYPSPGLSASNTLRVGYTTQNLTGVWDNRYGAYRVQPIGAVNFIASNPRTATPTNVGGNLKVASLNMLNYFVTLGDGINCGPAGTLACRGATDSTEFTRQRGKLINAILTINPDIVGLMEMENDSGNGAAQDLVDGLNAVAGTGTYTSINTGAIGADVIRVAIIYQPGRVTPVGNYAIMDSAVNPLFMDSKNRPSLVQTFALNPTGAKLTLVVNHLKSKGSDCIDVGDPDTGDGQGNCNLTRTNGVNALTQWLTSDPTGSGDPDYIIIGDLNAYAKEDPIIAFKNAGYTNLVDSFLGSAAYSYVLDGETGYLDHALASPTLAAQIAGVTEWHINADEPPALDYNTELKGADQIDLLYSTDPYRSSDHDPVIVGINLNPSPTLASMNPTMAKAGGPSFALTVTGTSFASNSVVRWNGNARATTFISATQLTANILASDINTLGSASITVFSPLSGTVESNALTFNIGQGNTTTTLVSSPNPSTFGQSVTFTATVTLTAGLAKPARAPRAWSTGIVTFKDGTTTLGTGSVNASGVATFTTTALGLRSHTIRALYSGDTNYNGSTSNQVNQVVNSAKIYLPLINENFADAPNLVVDNLILTSGDIQVVIRNMGTQPVVDEFWVDVYINPIRIPTAVNQTWQLMGSQGLTWGTTSSALPMKPGENRTLSIVNDPNHSFWPSLSNFTLPIQNAIVYVQVDSANAGVAYGGVRENHEIAGTTYDNIRKFTVTSGLVGIPFSSLRDPSTANHLPLRPR